MKEIKQKGIKENVLESKESIEFKLCKEFSWVSPSDIGEIVKLTRKDMIEKVEGLIKKEENHGFHTDYSEALRDVWKILEEK